MVTFIPYKVLNVKSGVLARVTVAYEKLFYFLYRCVTLLLFFHSNLQVVAHAF